MQVSQIKELDTHAILGGSNVEAFGMSDSAEFFTVLSDTLYRDKKRAVVREIVCNAWDAHLKAGKANTPVEITLDDNEMTIRDVGPGIPHDKLREIYCVYGASTKVNDEGQTGGFGLGSKAPFAYSDHFTVANHHAGTKVVCALSRGGELTGGKPSINVMVKTATTETGVTVTVPLATDSDRRDFDETIRSVVYQGGINAVLNGGIIETIDYSNAEESGFVLIPGVGLGESYVYIKYGSVIYPIASTDKRINNALLDAVQFLPTEHSYRLILIAKPNSVGVTPSREALSYSDKTVETVAGLLERFTHLAQASIPKARATVADVILKRIKEPLDVLNSWNRTISYASPRGTSSISEIVATKIAIISDPGRYFQRHSASDIHKELILTSPIRTLVLNRAMQKFPNFAPIYKGLLKEDRNATNIVFRFLSRLHIRAAASAGKARNLYVGEYRHGTVGWIGDARVLAKFDPSDVRLVDRKLYIAPTVKAFKAVVKKQGSDFNFTARRSYFMCVVNPAITQAEVKSIKETAKKLGIEVEHIRPEKVERAPVERNPHFINLVDLVAGKGSRPTATPSLEKAKFFVRGLGTSLSIEIDWRIHVTAKELDKIYGPVALALSASEEHKLRRRGAKCLYEHMAEELRKLSKYRSVQYEFMRKNATRYIGGSPLYNYEATYLAGRSWKIAKALFPARVREDAALARYRKIQELIRDVRFTCYAKSPRHVFDQIENELGKVARKAFPEFEKVPEFHFSYLTGMDFRSSGQNAREEFILSMIRSAQAYHRKSAITSEEAIIRKQAKEAA